MRFHLPQFQDATDPVTGDHLSAGERVSWLIQGVIRRWAFLGVITLATILVWSTRNADALVWWNLCASYLAIFIESIVGLAMFNQTRRDAVVIREVRAISQRVERITELVLKDVEAVEEEMGERSDTSKGGAA